jgi:hypothetical protein
MAENNEVNKNSVEAARRKSVSGKSSNLLVFPTKEMPHSILLIFKRYKYEKWADSRRALLSEPTKGRATGRQIELDGSIGIQLPFPKQLVDTNSIQISAFERNALIEGALAMPGVEDFLRGKGGSGGDTLTGMMMDAGKGIFNAAKGVGEYVAGTSGADALGDMAQMFGNIGGIDARDGSTALAYLLRSQLGNIPGMGGTAVSTLNSALGQVVNPRQTLTFEGVGLKSHSFDWELYPSNRSDSEMIKKIVHTVKRNTLPSTEEFVGIPRVLLNFPSTVDMYLLGVNQSHFMKFKTCMVSNVSVNYSAGGITSIAKGGVPATVSLSMSFSELDIETADDYPEGLLPPEVTGENDTVDESQQGAGTTDAASGGAG